MHQRNKFQKYIVPLIKDNHCCNCGCEINLEVHHDKLFSEILLETLNNLGIELKDTKDYTKKQLNLITDIMLGKQMQNTYRTLCEKCHTEKHIGKNGGVHFGKIYYERYRQKQEELRKEYDKKLETYLSLIDGKKLSRNEKRDLIEKCNFRKNGRYVKNMNLINKHLLERSLNFKIYSNIYPEDRKVYWHVERMR